MNPSNPNLPNEQLIKLEPGQGWSNLEGSVVMENTSEDTLFIVVYREARPDEIN